MSNKVWLYLLGFVVLIAMLALPFIINPQAEFSGSDDQGTDAILAASPGYTPWFEWFWHPPSETESFLFATQAAIGAIVIGYFIGYIKGRNSAGGKLE